MSASLIRHEPPKHPADDPSHPIPSLAVLDVVSLLKGGGARLYIVIASPLAADAYSLARLLDKIEGYLQHIQSREFQVEAGASSPENTSIIVSLHPGSAPEVYELLERSKSWVLANHASLRVEHLDVAVH